MEQYLNLLQDILDNGYSKSDRTNIGTKSVFGCQLRFNLQHGFPLLTTKKLHVKSILHELLWFLQGSTNINYLQENSVSIWDNWATNTQEIGPMYGKQWVEWQAPNGATINQIALAVELLKTNPNSRRNIVCAWNPADLPDETISAQENVQNGKMALAPCHAFFQLYCHNNELSMQVYQRSADTFLGVPFNIASYAFLLSMFAQQTNLVAKHLIWTGGDVHLYTNTIEQAQLQLQRKPLTLPRLAMHRKPKSIFSYKFDDFEIMDYYAHPHISAPIAV